jgi:dipeptidyl aminopeptidase/acylaminoacyl peptidase
MDVDGATVHDVAYRSDGLRIRGMVAVPETAGPHPLIWFNHGGFAGMRDDEIEDIGRRAAEADAVVVASMYRGEGGSDGDIEYCLGEVTDVWNLGIAVQALAPVQGPGVAIGSSHGACISLMLNARRAAAGTPLLGTVTLGTPSDVDTLIAWHYAEGDPKHAARWEPYLRGPENQEMSPRFAEVAPPLVLLHGLEDRIVPVEQGCLMRDAVPWPVRTHRVDADGAPSDRADTPCLEPLDAGDPWAPLDDGLRLIALEDTPHVPTPKAWNHAWREVFFMLTLPSVPIR